MCLFSWFSLLARQLPRATVISVDMRMDECSARRLDTARV